MAYLPRKRRLAALGLILVTNFGFYILPVTTLNSEKVAILISMILTVIMAFVFSALSHQVRVRQIRYKYGVSGVLGLVCGILCYMAIKDSAFLSLEWINSYGKLLLIGMNVLAALFLFFTKREKKQTEDTEKTQ